MESLRILIRKILTENNVDTTITNAVKWLVQKYIHEYEIPFNYINKGECMNFAEELEGILKEEGIQCETLSDGFFWDLFDEGIEVEDPGKYGTKPADFDTIGLPSHYWVYANGKHYDSDAPEGVTDMFQLPTIKNFYKKYSKQINESKDKKDKKILYIHGLGGTPKSDEINKLNGVKIIAPLLNYKNNNNLFDSMSKIIEKNNIDAVIGHSIGGYLAYYISEKYGIPCLIFAPSFDKEDRKFEPEPKNIKTKNIKTKRIAVIGSKDDVIKNKKQQTLKLKQGNYEIFTEKIGHDIPLDIKTKYINKLISNI